MRSLEMTINSPENGRINSVMIVDLTNSFIERKPMNGIYKKGCTIEFLIHKIINFM